MHSQKGKITLLMLDSLLITLIGVAATTYIEKSTQNIRTHAQGCIKVTNVYPSYSAFAAIYCEKSALPALLPACRQAAGQVRWVYPEFNRRVYTDANLS